MSQANACSYCMGSAVSILSQIYLYSSCFAMEQHAFKNVNNCLNTNVYSYKETSGGRSFNLNLNVVHFFNTLIMRQLWLLMTFVFLHWCLIGTVL
jgi:hypothetical protein